MRNFRATDVKQQIAVAEGLEPADLVLKGGLVFNVFTQDWEKADVAISGDKIVGLGEYTGTEELDISGKYVTPGFLDAHVHLESSNLAPREFTKLLLLNGVTTVFADPHEIANVMGKEGVEFILQETEQVPVDVFVMAPSCVPATNLETSGATLEAKDLQELLQQPRVLGLGEVMNYPGVLERDPEMLAKLETADLKDGHAPGLTGKLLNAYCAAGIGTEHEATTPEEAADKLSRGLYIFLREASGAHNLLDLLPMVTPANCRRCCLATDDRYLEDVIAEGSINYMIEIGVTHGYPVEQLLTMATINTAECFRRYGLGAVAPGYLADINVFDDLTNFQPNIVIKGGVPVVRKKQLLWESVPVISLPKPTMDMQELRAESFAVPAPKDKLLKAIGLVEGQLITENLTVQPLVKNGFAVSDTQNDILKLAVCERHHHTGNIGLGFVKGFRLKRGAVASTVAHDSHNLIILGTNDEDMAAAGNALRDCGGGYVVVEDGQVKARVPMPIAGLMSDQKLDAVSSQLKQWWFWVHELGVPEGDSGFAGLHFMALPVIPTLKLTDKGLVDVNQFKIIDLWE